MKLESLNDFINGFTALGLHLVCSIAQSYGRSEHDNSLF